MDSDDSASPVSNNQVRLLSAPHEAAESNPYKLVNNRSRQADKMTPLRGFRSDPAKGKYLLS